MNKKETCCDLILQALICFFENESSEEQYHKLVEIIRNYKVFDDDYESYTLDKYGFPLDYFKKI